MKPILAFAGSNSSTSINHTLVSYVADQIKDHQVELLKLTDYEMPMYSEDVEKEGFPFHVNSLKAKIESADALVISVNEHNGSWSAFFKNTMDWLSRLDRNFLGDTKVFLLSTSPGKRGGLGALEFAQNMFPRFGAKVLASYSFPSFYENFSVEEQQITDHVISEEIQSLITQFSDQI